MSFDFKDSPIAVRADIGRVFRREWERLALPGTWWTGVERIAVAAAARTARGHGAEPSPAPAAATEAAAVISARPASIRRAWVGDVAAEIGYAPYIEIVGITSRLAAIDTFHVALGLPLEPLPEPEPGPPSQTEEPLARPGAGWVPMVGGASITQALSMVAAESTAQEDLHGRLYLTYEEMAEFDFVRGLSRAQMELVAARTSALNECFY
jgi:hypothetical protein